MSDHSTPVDDAARIEHLQLEVMKLAALASALLVRLGTNHIHITRAEMEAAGMQGSSLGVARVGDTEFCLQLLNADDSLMEVVPATPGGPPPNAHLH